MMWFVFLWFYFWIGVGAAAHQNEADPAFSYGWLAVFLWPAAIGYIISKNA